MGLKQSIYYYLSDEERNLVKHKINSLDDFMDLGGCLADAFKVDVVDGNIDFYIELEKEVYKYL